MDIGYNNLDDEWINEFEKTDKLYEDFYRDDLYYINLRVIYVNRDNEIDKIKHETLLLSNKNNISREEIVGIVKKNSIDNERKYSLLSILRYNIILEPDDVKFYLLNRDNHDYLSVIKNIDTISFQKSISMFHDLNDIILIFYEKSKEFVNKRPNTNNNTKKIYLRSLTSNKTTLKKQYKD
jgi:hypothetical protein